MEEQKISGNGVIMDVETVPESWEERSEEDDEVIMLNEKKIIKIRMKGLQIIGSESSKEVTEKSLR